MDEVFFPVIAISLGIVRGVCGEVLARVCTIPTFPNVMC